MERRPRSIVRKDASSRGPLTRALALLVVALAAFPFTAPCPVCDLAAVIGPHASASSRPATVARTVGARMTPVDARGIADWAVLGEEPGKEDVLPVAAAPEPARVSAADSDSSFAAPSHPRTAAFLRAAPLRL